MRTKHTSTVTALLFAALLSGTAAHAQYDITPETRAAANIGATSATLPVHLPQAPDASGTLRVYYGATDGGDSATTWASHTDYDGAVDAAGVYDIPVSGLTNGQTYWYRHAFVVDDEAGAVFCFAPASRRFTAGVIPGLYESRYGSRVINDNGYPAPTNARIVPAPYALNSWGNETWSVSDANYVNDYWPPPASLYLPMRNNTAFRYTGYIYISEGSNTVTFCMNYDDDKRLTIDGEQLINNKAWNDVVRVTRTYTTGWHTFDIMVSNGSSGFGPTTAWNNQRIGFGIDWLGRDKNDFANFVFPEDPGDGSLFAATQPPGTAAATTLAASAIGDNSATLSGSVKLPVGASGTFRIYYGTTDAENEPSAWDDWVDYPDAVAESGTYACLVDGLELGETYRYRAAFLLGDTLFFATESLSFTTAEFDAPSRFAWVGGTWWANTDTQWNNTNAWENLDKRARQIPGIAGDELQLYRSIAQSRTYLLTNDVSVGKITAGSYDHTTGYIRFFARTPVGTPATLTLDSGIEGEPAVVNVLRQKALHFGEYTKGARHDDLRLHLASPLILSRLRGDPGQVAFHSPISGGTEDAPVPITMNVKDIAWGITQYVFLSNTNSTWRGDVTLDQTGGTLSLTLGLNYRWEGQQNWFAAHDGMLGDPANRVILRSGARLEFFNHLEDFVLQRTVLGTGQIRALVFDGESEAGYNNAVRRPLVLGETAVLSPGDDNTVGTLTLWGSSLDCDPGTTFRIKLLSDGTCDKLVFNIPGEIRLNRAAVELDLTALETARPAPGTTWTIATTGTDATVAGNFNCATSGYVVLRETAPDTGATQFVAYKDMSLIIIR